MNGTFQFGGFRTQAKTAKALKEASRPSEATLQTIVDFVTKHPGASAISIADGLEYGRSTIQNYAKVLTNEGRLERYRSAPGGTGRSYWVYYPVGAVAVKKAKDIVERDSTDIDKILQYASDHDGERYAISTMANDLSISLSSAYKNVHRLQQRRLLAKDFNLGQAKFRPQTTALEQAEEEETPQNVTVNVAHIEALAWKYIRANRNADLFGFMDWLDAHTDEA